MKPAYPAREFILRVLYFCLGTAVCALGCSAFVLSGIGTDPFSMLMQGVARTAHISNGTRHIAINFTLLVLYFFIDRKYIRAGTFAALFITGPMIDAASRLLRGVIPRGPALPGARRHRTGELRAHRARAFRLHQRERRRRRERFAGDPPERQAAPPVSLDARRGRPHLRRQRVPARRRHRGGHRDHRPAHRPIVQFFMPGTARLLYSILRRLTPQTESA